MKPMLADQATERQITSNVFLDDTWIMQPKVDGERRLIVCDGTGGVRVYGRDGQPTGLPGPVARRVGAVNMPIVLDGELLGGVLMIWDMPEGGPIRASTPCTERVTAAGAVVAAIADDAIRMVPTAYTIAEKAAMIDRVVTGRGEGVMAKLARSPYLVGKRCTHWRKVKIHHEIDCVVDYVGTEKANLGLAVYDHNGRKVPVGEVGRGTADGERVGEGDVVTVRVVHVSADGRLVQPTLPRLRHDKSPGDCSIDQLSTAYTDKNLLLNWAA